MTSEREFHDGKSTCSKNDRVVSRGMGCRVRSEEGSVGLRIEVDDGLKGDVDAGVSRAFRFVDMLSSMLARERRRKSRSTRVLKQNCGLSWAGGVVGCDMISRGAATKAEEGGDRVWPEEVEGCATREEEGEEVEADEVAQNHASLVDVDVVVELGSRQRCGGSDDGMVGKSSSYAAAEAWQQRRYAGVDSYGESDKSRLSCNILYYSTRLT